MGGIKILNSHSTLHFNTGYEKEMEQYLKKIWYDPRHPGSFAGATKLYEIVKKEGKYDIGLNRIKNSCKINMRFLCKKK